MENRSHAILAVSFLIVFSIGAAAIFLWLSRGEPENRIYELVSDTAVGGLQAEAPVKFQGLVVGHVKDLRFDPNDPSKVIVRIGVFPTAYVTHATYATLGSQGITGITYISLRLEENESREPLPTSAEHPAKIPMRPSLLHRVEQSGQTDLKRIREVLERIDKMLDESNREHVANLLAQLDQATQRLVTMEQTAMPTLKALPDLTQELRRNLVQSQKVLSQMRQLATEAKKPVRDVGSAAASGAVVARKLTRDTLPRIDALTKSLDRTLEEIDQLSRELQAQPQSVLFGAPAPPPGPGEPGFQPPPAGGKP